MTSQRFDTLCIGNAICDVFAHVEEDFLVREKLVKGSMRLSSSSVRFAWMKRCMSTSATGLSSKERSLRPSSVTRSASHSTMPSA